MRVVGDGDIDNEGDVGETNMQLYADHARSPVLLCGDEEEEVQVQVMSLGG
jgi:hypothetical protein